VETLNPTANANAKSDTPVDFDEIQSPPRSLRSVFKGLVGSLVSDARLLVEQEMALAKAEAEKKAGLAKRQIIGIAIGATVALTGLILFLAALAFGVSALFQLAGLPEVVSYLAGFGTLGFLFALTGIIYLNSAKNKLTREGLTPKKAVKQLKETKTWAQSTIK
jgi:hypothetical protein